MIYECEKVKYIWKVVGTSFKVNIRWKHVVIGYYDNLNNTTDMLNLIYSFIAYSIFKANNACKWNQSNYSKYDVKRAVINDLLQFNKTQMYLKTVHIKPENILEIVYQLENKY